MYSIHFVTLISHTQRHLRVSIKVLYVNGTAWTNILVLCVTETDIITVKVLYAIGTVLTKINVLYVTGIVMFNIKVLYVTITVMTKINMLYVTGKLSPRAMCYMSLESCDQEQCVTYDWYSYNPYQGVCATKTMCDI